MRKSDAMKALSKAAEIQLGNPAMKLKVWVALKNWKVLVLNSSQNCNRMKNSVDVQTKVAKC